MRFPHATGTACPPGVRAIAATLFGLAMFAGHTAAAEFRGEVLVFGGEAAYPPFEWVDAGEPTGMNVELQREIARTGGVSAVHRLGNWADVIGELESGAVDVVAMFKSPERERRFLFTQPFDFLNHAIYGLVDAPNVSSVDDLSTARVAVEELSYALLPLAAAVLLAPWYLWSTRKTLTNHAFRLVDESRLRKLAESRLRWAEDHFADTGMPRAQRFVATASALLAESAPQGQWQVVTLKLADLERTIRTEGHEAGEQAVRQFAERIREADFPACGQLGRDVFAIFADKARIAKEFRSAYFKGDTAIMKIPLPSAYAGAATWPQYSNSLPDLLRKAESALNYAVRRHEHWADYRPFMEPRKEDLNLPGRGVSRKGGQRNLSGFSAAARSRHRQCGRCRGTGPLEIPRS